MSWKVAGGVAAGAFLLSMISAGVGGSPFLEMFLRALFWGALALGSSLGIEFLLRRTLPELFVLPEAKSQEFGQFSNETGTRVDITLDPEQPFAQGEAPEPSEGEGGSFPSRPISMASSSTPAEAMLQAADSGEELPEIGSFLESFRPQAILDGELEDGGAPTASGSSSTSWSSGDSRTPTGDVILDGQAHDPTVLAKAVQTVLKKGQ
ncbi:MAG: hypothetical protein HKM06_01060 [Spirochaetales bacterium]|nr:hypothetical protein [Spirochaetales bacterium]